MLLIWSFAMLFILSQLDVGDAEVTLTISANPNGVISKDMKVILTCTSSDPNSKISGWMKDGVLLVVSEPLGPILIENLTYEDAGFYVCFIAGDEVLDVSTPYELQIADVYITGNIGQFSAIAAESLDLTCNYNLYDGLPVVSPIWTINNTPVSTQVKTDYITDETNCGSLKRSFFYKANPSTYDNGYYKCKVEYTGFPGAKTVAVEEGFFELDVSSDTTLNILVGTVNARLDCVVYGLEATSAYWRKSGGTDDISGRETYDRINFVQDVIYQFPSALATNDAGSYECYVDWDDSIGEITWTTTLNVIENTGVDWTDDTIVQFHDTSTVSLNCEFNNEHVAEEVYFYRGDQKVETNQCNNGKCVKLYKIPKILENTGLWSCKVKFRNMNTPVDGTSKKSLFVRQTVPTLLETEYVRIGADIDLTCTIHGDAMDQPEWKELGTSTVLDNVALGSYSNFEWTTQLNVRNADESKKFTCDALYKADSAKSTVATISLVVLKNEVTAPTTLLNAGEALEVTCIFTTPPTGTEADINWYFNGALVSLSKAIPSADLNTQKMISYQPVTLAHNGMISCLVNYGTDFGNPLVGEFDLRVRGVKSLLEDNFALLGSPSVKLECIFMGDDEFDSVTKWVNADALSDDLTDSAKYTITDGAYSDSPKYGHTATLTINKLENSDSGKYECSSANAGSGHKASQTLSILSITSLTTDLPTANVGDSLRIACEFTAFAGSGITVYWTKNGNEMLDAQTIASSTSNVLVLEAVTWRDAAVFRCTVVFGSLGSLYKEVDQFVNEVVGTKNYALVGEDAKVTCNFYGPSVFEKSWSIPTSYTSGIRGPVSNPIERDGTKIGVNDVVVLSEVTVSKSVTFDCRATYTNPEGTFSAESTLLVFDIPEITSSDNTANFGESFTLTCTFSAFSGTKVVTWNGSHIQSVSETITGPLVTQSLHAVESAAVTDNDMYTCLINYQGTDLLVLPISEQFEQSVRHVSPPSTEFGIFGESKKIMCTFYGDDMGTTSWFKESSLLSSGDKYAMAKGSYTSYRRTDTLTISALEAADGAVYTCKAAYSAGGDEIDSTVTLAVSPVALKVTFSRSPATLAVLVGTKMTFTCTYTQDDTASEVKWSVGGEYVSIPNEDLGKSPGVVTATFTTLETTQGSLGCSVTYPPHGEVSGSDTIYSRSLSVGVEVKQLYGETITLTCKVHGDEPASIVWKDSTNAEAASGDVTQRGYSNYLTNSELTVRGSTSNTVFKCEAWSLSEEFTIKVAGSQNIELPTMTGPSAAIAPNVDDEVSFTCTFTSADIATTVKLMPGELISKTVLAATSSLIIKVLAQKDTDYVCLVVYSDYGERESEALELILRDDYPVKLNTDVFLGGSVELACVFEGDASEFVGWKYGNTVLTSGNIYTIDDNYDEQTHALTAHLRFLLSSEVDMSQNDYYCTAKYKADDNEETQPQEVTVLDIISMTSSVANNKVTVGTKFDITCTYVKPSDSHTVEWFKNRIKISLDDDEYTIEDCSSGNTFKSCLRIDAQHSDTSKNGVYKCKVNYLIGSLEEELVHYVEGIDSPSPTVYAPYGGSATLTCVVHGSIESVTEWRDEEGVKCENGEVYQEIAGVANNFERTDKLVIKSVKVSRTGIFACTQSTLELEIPLNVISVAKDPENMYSDATTVVSMKCLTCDTNLEITEIEWYYGENKVPSHNVALSQHLYEQQSSWDTECDGLDTLGISPAANCQLAATELGIRWGGVTNNVPFTGCYHDTVQESVFYIATTNGATAKSSNIPICKLLGKVFESVMDIKNIENVDSREYKCVVKMPGSNFDVKSQPATFYRMGVKDLIINGYNGEYIESNQKYAGTDSVEFTEQYSIHFPVLVGPGIAFFILMFKDLMTSSEQTLVGNAGIEVDGIVPIVYTVPYAERETGEYTIEVGYKNYADIAVTESIFVNVYDYCEVDDLQTIPHGTWLPKTKVDFRSYATLNCEEGYYAVGVARARCGYAGKFLGSPTTELTQCVDKSSMPCGLMEGVENGFVNYSFSGSTASYECEMDGYTLMDIGANSFTCDKVSKIWTLYNDENTAGLKPICTGTEMIVSRSIDITIDFPSDVEFCKAGSVHKTADEELFSDQIFAFIKTEQLSECLGEDMCISKNFICNYVTSGKKVKIMFSLEQTSSLDHHPSMLYTDAKAIKSATIIIEVDDDRSRKRAVLDLTANAITVTTGSICEASHIEVAGECVQCPLGYGLLADKSHCEVCSIGSFSDVTNLDGCQTCSNDKTTYNIGSTSASDCKVRSDFCRIPAAPQHTGLNPSAASIVPYEKLVTVFCDTGYALEENVSETFRCTDTAISPICYRKCDLTMYHEESVSELEFMPNSIPGDYLVHGQALNISCESGHQTQSKHTYNVFRCLGNRDEEAAKMLLTPCEKIPPNSLLILGLCLGVVIIILVLLLVWCALKTDKSSKRRRTVKTEEMASTNI